MRTNNYLIVCLVLLGAGTRGLCQIVDPKAAARSAATSRANNKIYQGVDKSLDKVESGVLGIFKKKKKTAPADAPPSDPPPTAANAPQTTSTNPPQTATTTTNAPQTGATTTSSDRPGSTTGQTAAATASSNSTATLDMQPAGQSLQQLYTSLKVEDNWKAGKPVDWVSGQPSTSGGGVDKIHGAAFAAAACKKAGVYLLCPPDHQQDGLAAAQYDWLRTDAAADAGWHKLEGEDAARAAQSAANSGKPVIAVCKKASSEVLVALIMPKEKFARQIKADGPQLIMAGTRNHSDITLKDGWAGTPADEVLYYEQLNAIK